MARRFHSSRPRSGFGIALHASLMRSILGKSLSSGRSDTPLPLSTSIMAASTGSKTQATLGMRCRTTPDFCRTATLGLRTSAISQSGAGAMSRSLSQTYCPPRGCVDGGAMTMPPSPRTSTPSARSSPSITSSDALFLMKTSGDARKYQCSEPDGDRDINVEGSGPYFASSFRRLAEPSYLWPSAVTVSMSRTKIPFTDPVGMPTGSSGYLTQSFCISAGSLVMAQLRPFVFLPDQRPCLFHLPVFNCLYRASKTNHPRAA